MTDQEKFPAEVPASNPIDFEKELYKAFGQVKDFTLGMQIAKWFYDMGKNSQEPVSEDLEEAAEAWNESLYRSNAFKAGAKWQEDKDKQTLNEEGVVVLPEEEFERMKRSLIKLAEREQQMMSKAKSGIVQKDYQIEMDDGTYIDLDPSMSLKPSLAVKANERVKVIVIKEG